MLISCSRTCTASRVVSDSGISLSLSTPQSIGVESRLSEFLVPGFPFRSANLQERWINVAKLLRAYGGCLGIRRTGVEVCEKPGGVDKQTLIPGYLKERGELKHLSTHRNRKKNRFRQ
jgi:hypothetical protein